MAPNMCGGTLQSCAGAGCPEPDGLVDRSPPAGPSLPPLLCASLRVTHSSAALGRQWKGSFSRKPAHRKESDNGNNNIEHLVPGPVLSTSRVSTHLIFTTTL